LKPTPQSKSVPEDKWEVKGSFSDSLEFEMEIDTIIVHRVVFIIWAHLPESWLHAVGITYYPSR
jgi:hypothetical protein